MIEDRLAAVRRQMQRMGVDVLVVQSTDRFLNEYVPTDESARVWISGFTGSMGEVVIDRNRAYLIVDGRYWLQADKETDPALYEVVRVTHGTGIDKAVVDVLLRIAEGTKSKPIRIGYEPDRVTPNQLDRLRKALGSSATLKSLFPSPVEQTRGADRPPPPDAGIRPVDERRVGLSVIEKLDRVGEWLSAQALDALVVQRLDDIAYLSNLRGTELPYQATFKSIALATPETLFVGIDPSRVPSAVRVAREAIMFMPEAEFWTLIGKKTARRRIGYDPDHNTAQAVEAIERTGAKAVRTNSPLAAMKALKTTAELKSMKEALRRADQVVHAAIQWANAEVAAGRRVTEAAFADRVFATFRAHGAVGLSFKVISAAGKNGAVIHYSDPSPRRALKAGELMLLDTGAYFDEGYATDLTRTFLVGGAKTRATDEQRRYYTLVLKAALAGMRAVFPEGTRGAQLDALVRAPLWAEGLNYAHGTGHGVGINVHESPPRVAPGAQAPIEPGHVFSIEPGIYLPKFGGVRIENLCTVEPAHGKPGFLRVVPLTFSPLDKRLIDGAQLTASEKAWLKDYDRNFEPATIDVDGPEPSAPSRGRARVRKPPRKRAARRPR